MDHHRRCSRPVGKKMKTIHKKVNAQAQEPRSSSPDLPIPAEDLQETESEDYGDEEWDPHAGMKPSLVDAEVSDECWDPEDDPEEVSNEAFNTLMVKMLSDLGDDDPHDHEWKPRHKQRKKIVKNGQFMPITLYVCVLTLSWTEGPRKAPSFGPDVSAKSARSQRRPKHRRAMHDQSRLTSFEFTLARGPRDAGNIPPTPFTPASSLPQPPSPELTSSPAPASTASPAASASCDTSPTLPPSVFTIGCPGDRVRTHLETQAETSSLQEVLGHKRRHHGSESSLESSLLHGDFDNMNEGNNDLGEEEEGGMQADDEDEIMEGVLPAAQTPRQSRSSKTGRICENSSRRTSLTHTRHTQDSQQ